MSSSADFATPARGTIPPAAPGNLAAPHLGGRAAGREEDDDDDEDLALKVTAATAVASLVNAASAAAPKDSGASAKNLFTPSSSMSLSSAAAVAAAATVTPHEGMSSSPPSPPDSLEGNKTVRFEQETAAAAASSSSSSSSSNPALLPGDAGAGACGTAARGGAGGAGGGGGGVGLVYSNRGRYVSPARRSSKSPSPAGSSASASNASSWRPSPQPHPENQQQQQPPQQQPSPDEPSSTPGLETAVTNSPSIEDRHRKGQQPPEDREAEAASALAGVAAAAAAAAAASAATSENDALFEPKSPIPSLQEAGNMFLSTPKNKEVMMTPTDFSMDYGKPLFDTSNVLAWLQSPSGLFSPGFGNILHSPSKQGTPGAGTGSGVHLQRSTGASTPRTPVVSTSFFFSDVAKLPKSKSKSIICISPLATASRHGGLLSPRASHLGGIPGHGNAGSAAGNAGGPGASSLPLLSDTPVRGRSGSAAPGIVGVSRSDKDDPSGTSTSAGVDVHMAERDCMEDEDLTVLLQLAANSSSAVFRGKSGGSKDLGLPVIGGGSCNRNDPDKTLSRKPTLEMRTSSDSAGETETVASRSSAERTVTGDTSKAGTAKSGKSKTGGSGKAKAKGTNTSSSSMGSSGGHPSIPPTFGYGQDPFYGTSPHHALMSLGLPPGAPSGTMRVVVGGHPPPNSAAASAPGNQSTYGGAYGMHAHQPSHFGGMAPALYGYNAPPPPHPTNYYYPYSHPPHPPPPPSHPGSQSHPWSENGKKKSSSKTSPDRLASTTSSGTNTTPGVKGTSASSTSSNAATTPVSGSKKKRKPSTPAEPGAPAKKKNRSPQITDKVERAKAAKNIMAVNAASGGMNDKAASLAAAILRGVTMRPSGKWQAQLYFAGKSRYIGVFDSREKAALAYEIAREKLKAGPSDHGNCPKSTENLVNLARKAAFDGVNENLNE